MVQQGILQNNPSTVAVINRSIDALVILGISILVSYYYGHEITTHSYLMAVIALLSFNVVNEIQSFYVSWRTTPFRMEAWKLATNWTLSFLLTMGVFSLFEKNLFSQADQFGIWFFSILSGLIIYRRCLRLLLRYARMQGYNSRRVAIVGAGKFGQELSHRIRVSPWMGLSIVGHYDLDEYLDVPHELEPVPVLGNLEKLIADAKQGLFDKVYISLPLSEQSKIVNLVSGLADTTCSVYYFPDVFTFELLHARYDNLGGLPVISIYSSPMDGFSRVMKRAFDLVVGTCILALISIPMVAIAAAVKFTSNGPVFFKQQRYGIDGKPIKVWKFRSMTCMEDGDKVTQAKKGDNRLTPIGGFLRRTSLDELPQFINVIQGSMSIVGPRPHAIAHNEQYRKLISGYMQRHMVKPGITGWAQVNGWRGETDTLEKMQKRVEFDLQYIQNWSVSLDAKIVFMTIFKGFVNPNAY